MNEKLPRILKNNTVFKTNVTTTNNKNHITEDSLHSTVAVMRRKTFYYLKESDF